MSQDTRITWQPGRQGSGWRGYACGLRFPLFAIDQGKHREDGWKQRLSARLPGLEDEGWADESAEALKSVAESVLSAWLARFDPAETASAEAGQ